MEEYMMPCVNKKIFGIECMGCGTQRALALLFQGDFLAAFKMFPAIYTTILFFVFVGLHFTYRKRNFTKILIFLGILNATIMVISYFYKHLLFLTKI